MPLPAQQELRYRLRQQEIVVQFGLFALQTSDLDAIARQAVHVAAEGLQSSFAKLLQVQPDTDRLLIFAGVGWHEGVVGTASIGADIESPAGYAIDSGEPVLSNHLSNEDRFRTPEVLRRHGIMRAINVPIICEGRPFGVLEVDSQEPGAYTLHDIDFLRALANTLAAWLTRRRIEGDLNQAVRRREMLMRELNHRVKNNLQVVTALLGLEASRAEHPDTRNRFVAVSRRVHVLSRVHNQLQYSGEMTAIDFAQYLRTLTADLAEFYDIGAEHVELVTEADPLILAIDRAVPLALIVNELVINSMKHAFPEGQGGAITVRLRRLDDQRAALSVADDGRGSTEADGGKPGLGRQLVTALGRQINAELTRDNRSGTCTTITFPIQ